MDNLEVVFLLDVYENAEQEYKLHCLFVGFEAENDIG